MFQKILVPLDGSGAAESALPYARTLAEKVGAQVELLEVVDLSDIAGKVPDQAAFARNLGEHANRRLDQYLRPIAKRFERIPTNCRVEQGSPATAIIDAAAAEKGTLIVMATHGRSGLQRWLLGSVAERVLRGTANPLLLVRSAEPSPADGRATFGSIVVPLDGSKLGELALAPALELARSLKIEVVLVRTYELPATAYYRADDYPASAAAFIPSYAELVDEMGREAREYIESKVKELRSQGLEQVRSEVLEGNAAEKIIELARKSRGSLIAMCTHGRSGVKRWMLGSVTEKVVRHSGNPVLMVQAEE
jgi:nucleotide-binding universal stress UspA family protein